MKFFYLKKEQNATSNNNTLRQADDQLTQILKAIMNLNSYDHCGIVNGAEDVLVSDTLFLIDGLNFIQNSSNFGIRYHTVSRHRVVRY